MKVFIGGSDDPDDNRIALYDLVRRAAVGAGSAEVKLYHDLAKTKSSKELFSATENGIAWADVMFFFTDENTTESGIQVGIAQSENTIVVALSKRGSLIPAEMLGFFAKSTANLVTYSDLLELGQMVAAVVSALPSKGRSVN
ncbi:MAG: hypothetical protein ABL962_06590 [Fimbriimonadaceae bacterium]